MKKTLTKVTSLLLAFILTMSICFALVSCAGASKGGDEALIDQNNPSRYAVYSNGGTTVVYDGKVYFINGIPDYTDDSGDTNVEGEVVKGALYSADIMSYRHNSDWYRDSASEGEANVIKGDASDTHIPFDNNSEGIEYVSDFDYELWDYKTLGNYTIGSELEPARVIKDGKEVQNFIPTNATSIYHIKTTKVVGKKIGTAEYNPGLWIFDGRIYFATPSNQKNANGEYEYNKAEFYCYTIETGTLSLLYTTEEADASIPYSFYKQNGYVYLLTFEKRFADADDEDSNIKTGYILSTKIEKGKAIKTETIAEGVDSVYFPTEKTYDPSKEFVNGEWRKTPRATDFAYYVKKVQKGKNESSIKGENTYTLGMVAPSGAVSAVIVNGLNREPSVKGVADNKLFFKITSLAGKSMLEVTNLKAQYRQMLNDFGEEYITLPEDLKDMYATPKIIIEDLGVYTDIILMEDDESYKSSESATIAVIAYSGNDVYRVSAEEGEKKIWGGSAFEVKAYHNGMVYGVSQNFLACISAFRGIEANTVSMLNIGLTGTFSYSDDDIEMDFFPVTYETEYAGNSHYKSTEVYLSFFSNFSESAKNYMIIKKIDGVVSPLSASPCLNIGNVVIYERANIVCYDTHCINFMHDHSNWDDLDTLTEDEKEQQKIDNI